MFLNFYGHSLLGMNSVSTVFIVGDFKHIVKMTRWLSVLMAEHVYISRPSVNTYGVMGSM